MNRIDKLQDMLLTSPDDCFLLHALGLEYLKLDDTDNALQSFSKVLETDARYVGTYYHLGRLLERLGRRDEAIRTYETGIRVAGELRDLHARNELQMALDDLLDD